MTEHDELYQYQAYRLGHKDNVHLINNGHNLDIQDIKKVLFSERLYFKFFKAIFINILA